MATFRQGLYKNEQMRRLTRWFNAVPHPLLAIEIAQERISAVRWSHSGLPEAIAVEPLPTGAVVPSVVESNIADLPAVQSALEKACQQVQAAEEDVTLLLPDPVIRLFVQHFETFPRSRREALPLLRWKLKKSVPFDVDEMLISYVRQTPRQTGVNVVTGVSRSSIVGEYESLTRNAKLRPGVVLSSSIAALALVAGEQPTLMARIAGSTLTTAIVRGETLCGYRCTDLPEDVSKLTPRALLDEVFPAAAYYQDTWQEAIQVVKVAGLGSRLPEFVLPIAEEFHCPAQSLLESAMSGGRISEQVRSLVKNEHEGLLGLMFHRA